MSNTEDNKAEFAFVSQHSELTRLMQAADVFSPFKIIGSLCIMTFNFKEEECPITFEKCQAVMDTIISQADNKFKIVFLHLLHIQNKNTIILNDKILPYFDSSVREISNGTKWDLFSTLIERFGFQVTTNEQMFITNLKF